MEAKNSLASVEVVARGMENEKMLQDILETVIFIKDNAVTKEEFDLRLGGVETRLGGVESRLDIVEERLTKIEALMVTKDYLDDKLADLKGDIIVKQRKIEGRIDTLVTMLRDKNLLQPTDVKLLFDLRIFPHIID